MHNRQRKRDMDDTELNERIEPTLGVDSSSTKPNEIRTISVEEYKKQIEAAKKNEQKPDDLQLQAIDPYGPDPIEKSTWKKALGAVVGITLVSINVALVYFEIQPKTLKPTFSVATPWGVAEVWTPWGTDSNKVAQLSLMQIPIQTTATAPTVPHEKENSEVNTGYYDK